MVFERHLFDGETIRDDIAEICIAIDDALSLEPPVRKNSRAVAEAVVEWIHGRCIVSAVRHGT